jgi:transposase
MSDDYQSEVLDHLGLVAGMYDELGIGERLDELIVQDQAYRQVSIGQAVKAMVLNGLGFVNQRLYLVPYFFENKPVERLLGPGIEAAHLNDDVLGRALDGLYEHDVTALYRQLAQQAAQRLGLEVGYVHLDSSSFHVDGRYNSDEEPEEGVIHITQGYSRDHRPDLNQVVLDLICEQQAGIPLLMEPLSGNSDDKSDFRRVVQTHVAQLQVDYAPSYFVADSALYSADTLRELAAREVYWISRVPATLSDVKLLRGQVDVAQMTELQEDYRYQELGAIYAGVKQRWLLIHSAAAFPRAYKSATKTLERTTTHEAKAFTRLLRQEFACRADAQTALAAFEATLKVTHLAETRVVEVPHYATRGRPAVDAVPVRFGYQIEGAQLTPRHHLSRLVNQNSCFVLATNQLDPHALPAQAVLDGYKGQVQTERGFRFLKDPLFLASSLFLKRPQRIMALMMVMTLCLLIYAALQRRIRTELQAQQQTFPDQKGNPTQTPTTRWIFHYFVGIHLLRLPSGKQLVLNLNDAHRTLLGLLGPPYLALYS